MQRAVQQSKPGGNVLVDETDASFSI